MGEITDYTGKLTLGHNVQIGYFAQNQASLLDEELTVFQTVDDVTPSELKSNTKNLLGAFMFSGDDIDKKVKVLSGGERTRLAMIKLLLQPVNLLIQPPGPENERYTEKCFDRFRRHTDRRIP